MPSDGIVVSSSLARRTRKRLGIGYNSESFSVKSACVGINPLRGWNLLFVGLTRRMTQYTASGMHMWWNPANAGLIEADLISSEVAHRRFHPSSLRFHPAKQDFIKFVWLSWIVLSLQAFLLLAVKNKSFNYWLLIRLKELLIFNGLCDIISSPIRICKLDKRRLLWRK